jgi:hypothetical protein
MPRRDIDKQTLNLPFCHGLKVFADDFDMPTINERNTRLNYMPRLLDEVVKRGLATPA